MFRDEPSRQILLQEVVDIVIQHIHHSKEEMKIFVGIIGAILGIVDESGTAEDLKQIFRMLPNQTLVLTHSLEGHLDRRTRGPSVAVKNGESSDVDPLSDGCVNLCSMMKMIIS